MLRVQTRKQYRKDFKKLKGERTKNFQIFKEVIQLLCQRKPLPEARKDHALSGHYKGCRECHIAPDWLLIYIIDEENERIILVRIGSHSELF
jgi:mRNA interferase YafQ